MNFTKKAQNFFVHLILYKGDHNINTKGEKRKRNNKKTLIYFFYSNKSGHIKADCFSFKKLQQKNISVEQSKSSATVKVVLQIILPLKYMRRLKYLL